MNLENLDNLEVPLNLITSAQVRHAIARLERGWTKEYYARDAEGEGVTANDPRAQCWCIKGAFYTGSAIECAKLETFFNHILPPVPAGLPNWTPESCRIAYFNDTQSSSKPILDLLNTIASKLEAAGQ